MTVLYKMDVDVLSDNDWNLNDFKRALVDLCAEFDLNMEGMVTEYKLGKETDQDYIEI